MTPTEMAKLLFENAGRFAQAPVMRNGSDPRDIKDIAAAVRDTADGLQNLAVGLRATYILLEEVKGLLADQNRKAGFRP